MKEAIYSYTRDELYQYFDSINQPTFRANQVFQWLYKKRITTFSEMTNLPKELRDTLDEQFDLTLLKCDLKQISKDGTVKFLFQTRDDYFIESVLMEHDYGYSVCVTTQIGCKMGCTFCASTLGGIERNLTSGEIVAQVMAIQRYLDETDERISSIVIMGSGEPFDNFKETMRFIEIINDEAGLNIGARHITVSTCGIVPKIYEFADLNLQVTLAVSLHATTNEVRSRMMPVNRAYPLETLIAAMKYYNDKTKRRISIEFGLVNGVNDTLEEADRLAKLVKPLFCHINLIPINYVFERGYEKPSLHTIQAFKRRLEDQGVNVTIRREKGSDIDAACGQLRAKRKQQLQAR